MIVDSMTYEEIIDLWRKDVPLINHKIEEGAKIHKKMIIGKRNRERVYFKPVRFQSNRGFNYVIQSFDRGTDYPSKERSGAFYYFWFRKDRGIYAISLSQLQRQMYHFTIYTPHFWDRYRERCLKDLSMSKPDVIHTYLMRNLKVGAITVPSNKYPKDYWVIGNDGLSLCNLMHDFIVEAKTFVSWDMLGLDQQELAVKGRQYLLDNMGFEIKVPFEDFTDYTKDE